MTKEQRQLDDLAKATTIQHFGAGEQLVCQGERVRELYEIIAGTATMTVKDDAEGELKVLTLGQGEFLGYSRYLVEVPAPSHLLRQRIWR